MSNRSVIVAVFVMLILFYLGAVVQGADPILTVILTLTSAAGVGVLCLVGLVVIWFVRQNDKEIQKYYDESLR